MELRLRWRVSMELSARREVTKLSTPPPSSGAPMANPSSLLRAHGRSPRILIVEDELLIAVLIGEMVREIGYRVSGTAPTIAMARLEFAKRNFDAVLLDLNLDGQQHPETADLLLEYGVPFAFVTGYDYLVEPRHEKIPILQKPFTPIQLRALLETLVGAGSSRGDSSPRPASK